MKLLLFAFLFPVFCQAQKIAESKVDEFTHMGVKRTSWDHLVYKFAGEMYLSTRINKLDSIYYLEVKYQCIGGCTMEEGAKIMFKMDDDSIVSYSNLRTTLSCPGCGAIGYVGSAGQGIDVSFVIMPADIIYLSKHKVAKVRIYTTKGYDEDTPGASDSKNLQKQAALMQ